MTAPWSHAVYVCRQLGPHFGKRCRIVSVKPLERNRHGKTIVHMGDESVLVQFEDGTRGDVLRRQILREGGLQARQIRAKAEARL
jgi:hypothetical protein